MARVDLPQSRLRTRRRRRRWLLGGALALALLLILGGLAWASRAPFLRVTSVQVIGAQAVASTSIAQFAWDELSGAYGWLFARNNIFLYPRQTIAGQLLLQNPSLRAVDVHAQDFHTVVIKVTERTPVALWCDTYCYYMDEQGFVYAPAPQDGTPAYISYQGPIATTTEVGLRQYLTTEEFQSLAALMAALAQKMPDNPVGQVAVDDNLDTRVYFQNSFLLMFNLKDDGGDVFERFILALSSDVFKDKTTADFEYLDLRFGDKLYYKLK